MTAIKDNGTKVITINMGELNCSNEPNIINLYGKQFILRYKDGGVGGGFGTITLEDVADA